MTVLESSLAPHLKQTAVVMALFANQAGDSIFPSTERVAWLVGKSRRRISDDLTALCDLGVLVPLTPRTGGRSQSKAKGAKRGRTTQYRLNVSALPPREAWQSKDRHRRPCCDTANQDTHVPVDASKGGRGAPVTRTFAAPNQDTHVSRSVSSTSQIDPSDGVSLSTETVDDEFHSMFIRSRDVAKALARDSSRFECYEDFRAAVVAELQVDDSDQAIDHAISWVLLLGPARLQPKKAQVTA